jgi:uncharacterized protein YndB with AHSA1/START domain
MIAIDQDAEVAAIARKVERRQGADGNGEEIAVVARRPYPALAANVWAALAEPDRLRRWFLPVSGDLRPGGAFQTEGNAGGTILRCEPGRELRVTWGDANSVVALALAEDGAGGATLDLEHTVPIAFAGNGTGAFFVGPGWDAALLALDRYLRGLASDPAAEAESPEMQRFAKASLLAWAEAVRASGTATAEEIEAGVAATLPQWAPDAE